MVAADPVGGGEQAVEHRAPDAASLVAGVHPDRVDLGLGLLPEPRGEQRDAAVADELPRAAGGEVDVAGAQLVAERPRAPRVVAGEQDGLELRAPVGVVGGQGVDDDVGAGHARVTVFGAPGGTASGRRR